MKFTVSKKLCLLLGLISTFAVNSVKADDTFLKNEVSNEVNTTEEQFYLVLVKNKLDKKSKHNKREDKVEFLTRIVDEINNLIIDNKDTYEDLDELQKLEQAPQSSILRKRDGDEDDEENRYAYVISSLEKESMILTYLSEDLVPLVKDLPDVKSVIPNFEMEEAADKKHDDLKRLPTTATWERPCVKGNTYNYLSLISQDKYNDSKKNASYDKNYYYPSTAGKGTNIFILDSGFDFRHTEFSNKDDRIAECLVSTDKYGVYDEHSEVCTYGNGKYHGHQVADMAGGLTNGVAPLANIYGISVYRGKENTNTASFVRALEYINENYLDESNPEHVEKYIHKTIVNISSSFKMNPNAKISDEEKALLDYFHDLIDEMNSKGSVFVVAAGNQNTLVDGAVFPCTFDNVICAGAIDNVGINETYDKVQEIVDNRYNTTLYPDQNEWYKKFFDAQDEFELEFYNSLESKDMLTKGYRKASFSNYGEKVNMYAPGYIKAFYKDESGVDRVVQNRGTSFSSPIVAGVAALYMGEYPYYKYNTKTMLDKLNRIGFKNGIKGIKKGHPNVFVNNGKKTSYSYSETYNTCGTKNDICKNDKELECFHHGCCLVIDKE